MGTWVAQLSIRLLISAQVIISWFVRSSPHRALGLKVWSLSGILLSLELEHTLSHSLSK